MSHEITKISTSNLNNCHDSLIDSPSSNDCDLLESETSDTDDTNLHSSSLTILKSRRIKINESFIYKFENNEKILNRQVKESCKILHCPSTWEFEDLLVDLSGLNSKELPKLFIFVIELKSLNSSQNKNVKKLKQILRKFGQHRPLVLQLTSEFENVTKFYYKEEKSSQFFIINQQQNELRSNKSFPSFFLYYIEGKIYDFEDELAEILPSVPNSALLLRFLRIFNLSDEFFGYCILNIPIKGTKSELLAALDAPFETDGRVLSNRAQRYLSDVFDDDESTDELPVESETITELKTITNDVAPSSIPRNSYSRKLSRNERSSRNIVEPTVCEAPKTPQINSSVLYNALKNENKEIIDCFMTYWTHLIQQLPFDHQVQISKTAFETNQIDVLCDLLETSDFPFPPNFTVTDKTLINDRLDKIITIRCELFNAIQDENYDKINEFINLNRGLKIAYNQENKSASKHAIDTKKFKTYSYLKSYNFKSPEFDSLRKILSGNDLIEANRCISQQRQENVNDALTGEQRIIHALCDKSLIHNRKITKELELEYRKMIKKWFVDINRIKNGHEFLKVAASCEHLKIIFDFESDTVEGVSLSGPNVQGSMYPKFKWIFIGAKLSDKKREQQIKGVLVHELCHYVMRLIYENQEKPYYKHMVAIADMFEEIVKITNKWSLDNLNGPGDECNGIISSVFREYEKNLYHVELIVRAVHILVEFDDDEEKSTYLQKKYQILFVFWNDYVIPDIVTSNLKDREKVRKMNRILDLLPYIQKENIEFISSNELNTISNNNFIIIKSNVPRLCLINVYNELKSKYGILADAQNIFVDPQKIECQEIANDLTELVCEKPEVNIIVDFSKDVQENLAKLILGTESSIICVFSNKNKNDKLLQYIKSIKTDPIKIEINYKVSDLTKESQINLLKTEISFQSIHRVTIDELLTENSKISKTKSKLEKYSEKMVKDFCNVVDDETLNLIMEKQQILVNKKVKDEIEDIKFKVLYRPRKFLKTNPTENTLFTQLELLQDVKLKHYVLISDIAGNGKSWVMKSIANMLCEKYPTYWVTFVDLKQHISEFKKTKTVVEFSTFLITKILKLNVESFDAQLLNNFYENGKVLILFDGFDEIAPNCAEFVIILAKSFKYNDGNQLWIATRDYFEFSLQKKLSIGDVYKLDTFTESDGMSLIVKSWLMTDLEYKIDTNLKDDIESYFQSLPNFIKYHQRAHQIIQKVISADSQSIGMPQIFKMIADGFKNDEKTEISLELFSIFHSFAQKLYERWADEKGQLRKKASIKSQEYDLNFWKFHQFHAVLSEFPKIVKIYFNNYNGKEWPEEEVIACGVLSIRDKKVLFLHETVKEFFVADLILKKLRNIEVENLSSNENKPKKKKKKSKEYCLVKLVCKILTNRKYGTIRIFMNDIIGDPSIMNEIKPKLKENATKLYESENFVDIFTKNLNNLANYVIDLLKAESYMTKKEILYKSTKQIVSNLRDPALFSIFWEFMIESLEIDDLKALIIQEDLLSAVLKSNFDPQMFKSFTEKIKAKTGDKFVHEIFTEIVESKVLRPASLYLSVTEVHKTINNYKKKLKLNQELSSMQYKLKDFHWSGNKEDLVGLWIYIEKQLETLNASKSFRDILRTKTWCHQNLLYSSVIHTDLEFYKTMLELLVETLKNRDELKEFLLEVDYRGNNFLNMCFKSCHNFKKITNTIKITKDVLNKDDDILMEILGSIDLHEVDIMNMEFRKHEKSYDFIHEMEKIATRNAMRSMLSNLGPRKRNLLQTTAFWSTDLIVHENLWKIFQKYFDLLEILEFIKHVDEYGNNLLFNAVWGNTRIVTEVTWNHIKSLMNLDQQIDYLNMKGLKGRNLIQISLNNVERPETHLWVKNIINDYDIQLNDTEEDYTLEWKYLE